MSDFIIKEEFFEAEADTSDRFCPCPKPTPCPVSTGPDLSGGDGPVVLPTAAPSINFSGAVTLLSEADAPSFSSLGLELPGLAGHSAGRLAGHSAGYSAGHSLFRQPDVTIADANLPTTMVDGDGRSAGHLFTDSTMVSSDDDLIIEGDSPSVGRTLSGHSLKKPPDLRVDGEELVLPNSELVLPNSMSPLGSVPTPLLSPTIPDDEDLVCESLMERDMVRCSYEPNVGSTLDSILSIESGIHGVLAPEVRNQDADASGFVFSQPMAATSEVVSSQPMIPKVRQEFNGFDPRHESVDQFIDRFDDFSEHYRWTDEDQLFYLRHSIPKDCEQILWDKGRINSVEELVKSLHDFYSDSARSTRSRRELRMLVRGKDESLGTVYGRVKRLAHMAWPEKFTSPLNVQEQIDAFADALEPHLRNAILRHAPDTLEEALQISATLEARELSHSPRFSDDRDQEARCNYASGSSLRTATAVADPSFHNLQKEVDDLKETVDKLQKTKMNKYARFKAPVKAPVLPQRCFNCLQVGHFKAECLSQHATAARNLFPPLSEHRVIPVGHPMGTGMRVVTQNYIKVEFGGKNYPCVIDTGCEYPFLPRKLIPKMVLKPTNLKAYTATGQSMLVSGTVDLHFLVQGTHLRATCLVTDSVEEMILGYRWLEEHSAVWNFGTDTISFPGWEMILKTREPILTCKRIYVQCGPLDNGEIPMCGIDGVLSPIFESPNAQNSMTCLALY